MATSGSAMSMSGVPTTSVKGRTATGSPPGRSSRPATAERRPPVSGSCSSHETMTTSRSGTSARCGAIRGLTLLVDECDPGARVGQAVGELLAGPPGVEGNGDGADGDRGPERHHPVGQVPHGDGNPVAGSHTESVDQLVAECRHGAEVFGEGDPLVLVDEKVLVAVEGGQLEDGAQARRADFQVRVGIPRMTTSSISKGTARGGQRGHHGFPTGCEVTRDQGRRSVPSSGSDLPWMLLSLRAPCTRRAVGCVRGWGP